MGIWTGFTIFFSIFFSKSRLEHLKTAAGSDLASATDLQEDLTAADSHHEHALFALHLPSSVTDSH